MDHGQKILLSRLSLHPIFGLLPDIPPTDFASPLPFTLAEPGDLIEGPIDDIIPNRIYEKQELLDYLQFTREKCYSLIYSLTEDKLNERWIEDDGHMDYPILEILLYNMRHVQHHAAQMNLLLRQQINEAPGWVGRAKA